MNEYLSTYGQQDERRGKIIKRTVIVVLATAVVGVAGFMFFRTWFEERAVNAFLTKLKEKDYKAAYVSWGCTDATPCKGYPFEKFLEDWGPQGTETDPNTAKIEDADVCDGVVIVTVVSAKGGKPSELGVAKSTGTITFAPPCYGKHWRFKSFFKRIFG